MIFFRAAKYMKYFLFSRHRRGYGIHSPFVFDLISRVFRNKMDKDIVCTIEKVRKKMLSDHRFILLRDLGSKSGLLKTNFKRVSDIARYSPVTQKYGELLSNMAHEFGKPLIIEFGTSLGISAMYMAASDSKTTVYTMEGCPETAEIARQNIFEAGMDNIKIMEGPFDEFIPVFENSGDRPSLVFIDGNHRKEPVIKYFNRMAEISDSKTVIIVDDINYSYEMAEAWDEIKLHKKVSLSIDIFRMGILFFREGFTRNDYIIRY